MIRLLALALLCLFALAPSGARAHALEPGFLEIMPYGPSEWRVTWRKPQVQGRPMAIDAVLPEGCSPRRGGEPAFDGRAFLSGWVATCDAGLAGGEIRIEGLERTRTDVLVRHATAPGAAPQATRLTAATPAFTVPAEPGALGVAAGYFALGVDHILKGVDHLLFVLMLLLLIRDWRPLLAAVTSFTVAHSLSLAAASLGWIVVPAPPVEAIVALSIAFLAAELLHERSDRPTGRAIPVGRGFRLRPTARAGVRTCAAGGRPARGRRAARALRLQRRRRGGPDPFHRRGARARRGAWPAVSFPRAGSHSTRLPWSARLGLRRRHARGLLDGRARRGVRGMTAPCRQTGPGRAVAAASLVACLVPAPALAHDAFGDLGPFYASFLHPLADPLQAALLVGTAAFLAGRPLSVTRAALPVFTGVAALTVEKGPRIGVIGFQKGPP
jgi:hydrogenase/urease accessory protein HupE